MTSGLDTLSSGKKSYDAFAARDYVGGAKHATKSGASATKVASALTSNKTAQKVLGTGGTALKAGSSGLSMVEHLQKGENLEAAKDGFSLAGNGFKLVEKLHPDKEAGAAWKSPAAAASGIVNTYDAIKIFKGAGHETKEEKEADDYIYGHKYIEGIEKSAEAVGDFADAAGPQGKMVAGGAKAFKAGMELGDRGNRFAAKHQLHGKDKDGHNRAISDVVEEKGTETHHLVHDLLGEGTASDILSHVAGGARMLTELPGAGLEAAGLGVAGYAEDLYGAGKEMWGTASDYAAKLWHGLF